MYTWRRIDEVDGRVIVTHLSWDGGQPYLWVADHGLGTVVPKRPVPVEIARRLTRDEGYQFKRGL